MKIKEGGGMDIEKEREAFEKECRLLCYKGNMVMSNLGSFYNNEQTNWMWQMWLSAKAQAVPEGFVLVSAEQMSQWGHMANCAEEYGCPECYEARGYAHNLSCEINAYFNVSEAQEPAND